MQRWEYLVWQVDLQERGGCVLNSVATAELYGPRRTPVEELAQGIGGPIAPALKYFGEQGWELAGALYILKRLQNLSQLGRLRRFVRWLVAAD